jgi:hypothetical protein
LFPRFRRCARHQLARQARMGRGTLESFGGARLLRDAQERRCDVAHRQHEAGLHHLERVQDMSGISAPRRA